MEIENIVLKSHDQIYVLQERVFISDPSNLNAYFLIFLAKSPACFTRLSSMHGSAFRVYICVFIRKDATVLLKLCEQQILVFVNRLLYCTAHKPNTDLTMLECCLNRDRGSFRLRCGISVVWERVHHLSSLEKGRKHIRSTRCSRSKGVQLRIVPVFL